MSAAQVQSEVELWRSETIGKKTVEALERNGFTAFYVPTGAEALAKIEEIVKKDMTVAFGGSMTIKAIGVPDMVKRAGAVPVDHATPGLSPEQKFETMRAELTSDLFLSSANAITLGGEICNVDGNGNRVAALTFGPKKTVVVAGVNKIVKDLAEAETRFELFAAPMNNKRLNMPNPCVKTGVCADCKGERRICRVYSVLKRRPSASDFTVIIVGESLGY